ncbi:MAG: hypothetical protein ACP5P3_00405 [Ignavibacteria bacterium]
MKRIIIFIPLVLLIIMVSCSDNSIDSTQQYVVENDLFFQKDYDSVYWFGVYTFGFQKLRIKKIKISFDLITNDITDSLAYMQIIIQDGVPRFNKVIKGYNCNGHFDFEYEFNITLDSILYPPYLARVNVLTPNGIYLLGKNFKAYRSY